MIHMKKAHKAAAVVLFVLWAAVAVWHYQTRTKPELAQREAAERLSNAETDASDFLLARGENGLRPCLLLPAPDRRLHLPLRHGRLGHDADLPRPLAGLASRLGCPLPGAAMSAGFDTAGRPFADNPQIAEIKRLEAALAEANHAKELQVGWLKEAKDELTEERRKHAQVWPMRFLKRLLRVLLTLLWFFLAVGLCAAPWWLCLAEHRQADFFYLLIPGLGLGLGLWFYVQES